MSETLKVAFMCLIWALVLKFQIDYEQDQTATRNLKNGLELAVHDSAMMLDVDRFSEGYIVFNQELSEIVFKRSLNSNLNIHNSDTGSLDGIYTPSENSFFSDDVYILSVEFIDVGTTPDIEFPCVYGISCGNDTYEVNATITGPSMVVVAETLSPRIFSSKEVPIRQAVVYEYKDF